MNYYIVVFLAIIVSTLIVLTTVYPMLVYHESLPEFSLAYDLKKSLSEDGEFHTNVDLYVFSKPVKLFINNIEVNVFQTYIVFRVRNGPILNGSDELFNVWCNQTHAGIVSGLELKDNGYILTIYFINSTSSRTNKVSIAYTGSLVKKIAVKNGRIQFLDKSYYIDGYRVIEIREIRLKS